MAPGEECLPKVAAILWRCLETAEGLTHLPLPPPRSPSRRAPSWGREGGGRARVAASWAARSPPASRFPTRCFVPAPLCAQALFARCCELSRHWAGGMRVTFATGARHVARHSEVLLCLRLFVLVGVGFFGVFFWGFLFFLFLNPPPPTGLSYGLAV